ncbi:disease resistance protein RPV1-like [Cryptomeria japonica]|uniref:disease resistance protein RPV1-like n=1 Tax=Cryptomeria japonica TaxID=3369 RepID=UPI0027DA0B54|nr:disease resistance protein RPV1-like [Cryptomeria japonica]
MHHLEELWETDRNASIVFNELLDFNIFYYCLLLVNLIENLLQAPVQLRELLISECSHFQRFPESIGCLRQLKKIAMRGRSEFWGLRSLPDEFCLLQSLEHLELNHCGELSLLPNNFGNLRSLRHLDLSNCKKLRMLPVSFKELTLLQQLNLEACSNLILESDILENMTGLEYLKLSGCERLEELPRHVTNLASLTELYLFKQQRWLQCKKLREVPWNIGQLSKLQKLSIGSELLTSLPTSIGDLSSLTSLEIYNCYKLECLPESLGCLNLLENLQIFSSGVKSLSKSFRLLINLQTLEISQCSISELDLGARPFSSSFRNLKSINLRLIKVCKISISEDCCPALESLMLSLNKHLTEIDVLPMTVKRIELERCKILRNIRGIYSLVRIQTMRITGCPELDALPNFAQYNFLRHFELRECHGVKKIAGLEHCRELVLLRVHTRWKEAGIESLEGMERLSRLDLKAISISVVEGCIRSMQAVPDAASLLNSFDFSNLSVVDSFANQKISSRPSIKRQSSAC